MKHRMKQPRTLRMFVYALALIVGIIGIILGIVDVDTVDSWLADGGVVSSISLAVVSLLAGANLTPEDPKREPEPDTQRKVDELRQIRKGYAM